MSILKIIWKEIFHRSSSFLTGALLIGIALSGLLVSIGLVKDFDNVTETSLESHESESKVVLNKLEDDIRKEMKGLGFNIYIFPEGQDLKEVYSQGYASKTMPESYVTKLAETKTLSKINHLLPSLTRKLIWPENNRTVVLIGIRGEVPIVHRGADGKKGPLIDPVHAGEIVVGFELHQSLNIKQGDKLTLMGKEFKVSKLNSSRGNVDDISLWINLEECQALLKAEAQINAILALECNCASIDRLGEIRKEIEGILPGTTVIEIKNQALARAEARMSVKKSNEEQRALLQQNRSIMRQNIQNHLFSIITALALVAIFTIAILGFNNVNERRVETGVFRAIGCSKGQILQIFIGRALLCGLLGVVITLVLAPSVFLCFGTDRSLFSLVSAEYILYSLFVGPILSAIASLLPALSAAKQDPAEILRLES